MKHASKTMPHYKIFTPIELKMATNLQQGTMPYYPDITLKWKHDSS
jgi:hypothetical protein